MKWAKGLRLRTRRQILQNFVELKQFYQVEKLVHSYLIALNQTDDQTNVFKFFKEKDISCMCRATLSGDLSSSGV